MRLPGKAALQKLAVDVGKRHASVLRLWLDETLVPLPSPRGCRRPRTIARRRSEGKAARAPTMPKVAVCRYFTSLLQGNKRNVECGIRNSECGVERNIESAAIPTPRSALCI